MKIKLLLAFLTTAYFFPVYAGKLSGTISDNKKQPLAFSSVLVKGTLQGTTANNVGKYLISLRPGEYTIVVQHIGYKSLEKKIVVGKDDQIVNFELQEQQYDLGTVIIKKGEDPAYGIIRNAIKKRSYYETEIKRFSTDVYLKGQMKLRDSPKKFMGQTVDFEDGDTSKKRMIFLSETVAKYSVEEPNRKVVVTSSRVSGQSDGFGFANPQIVSFYENTVKLGNTNPRGFISPISNNALAYYKYKFEGTFFENNQMINRIKVIPKRKYEPLFNGFINIIEDEWRIQSVELVLYKENQMQFIDTLKIDQIYIPYKNKWVIKQQTIYPAIKIFSFDVTGSFVQVYDNFDLDPTFEKGYFGSTVLKFEDSANKKSTAYWDTVRPVPLLDEEVKDYRKKDSLEIVRKDPKYMDSLDRKRNKIRPISLLTTGQSFSKEKSKVNVSIDGIISSFNYNTVEGVVIDFSPSYFKSYGTNQRKSLSISPHLRYGFGNEHFNPWLSTSYTFGKKHFSNISLAGGKRVYQLDNSNPIAPRLNTFSTLFYERNYMKIYEAAFGSARVAQELGNGFVVSLYAQFQNRLPLENTSVAKWRNLDDREFTPNISFTPHQAFVTTVNLRWQPGTKYVELPSAKFSIGSKYPSFNLSLTNGIKKIFGSDVNFSKWRFQVNDNLNLKLAGALNYRIAAGGFLSNKAVFFPDFQHFTGNQMTLVTDFSNVFQLMPYYSFSNTEKFYTTVHVEYHLNGLLTNKIPFFKKLNWFMVTGTNLLHLKSGNNYGEVFVGLENILKVIRVEYVRSFNDNIGNQNGIRFSLPILFSGGND